MPPLYEKELAVALAAADRASKVIIERYADFQAIPNAPASITTDVDRQSQEVIVGVIKEAFGTDAFCAEETTEQYGQLAGSGPRLWIIDPIDGTRGFARKNDEFSVMIAFLHQGELAVGVVAEPAKRRLTWASRGQGCWRRDGDATTPTACKVTNTVDLLEASLVQTRSRDPGVPTPEVRALRPVRVLETYSAGVKLALVARGEADLYVNNYSGMHDWDVAAGHILVTEAGGHVTGLGGQPVHYGTEGAWQRHGMLASNRKLHDVAVGRLVQGAH
jgi:3'(2'), 5'-bisphosphate nucleotidase